VSKFFQENRFFLLIALLSPACIDFAAFSKSTEEKPNIILIFADDLGWRDIACYGNTFVETPHIDKLSKEGMLFTDFYASGATCSATRCALQSGQNQVRIGITEFVPGHWRPFEKVQVPMVTPVFPADIVTVAESLKKIGHATGYVGKWHLGPKGFLPDENNGYGYSVVTGGAHLYGSYRVTSRHSVKPKKGQYRSDFEADLSVDFINKNKDKPFFLMVSPYTVHIPLQAMSGKVKKYRAKAKKLGVTLPHPVYAAMIEHMDDLVGRIVEAVEKNGLTGKTMILFTSDNGGLHSRYDYNPKSDDIVTTNAPLRNEKGSIYEGGIRVPLIVKYPGVIKAGSISKQISISHDFYPTFVELLGGVLPKNQTIDGVSLLPVLTGKKEKLERQTVYWHYPHFHHHRPTAAIREGDWKLIQYIDGSKKVELYNLRDDISEKNNLSQKHKGVAAGLQKKLRKWQSAVSAKMPIPNPAYDASRAHEWWSRRNGKKIDSNRRRRAPQTEKDIK
jgi:arylsulfatase A